MKKSFTKQLISLILAVCFTLAFPALSFAADSNQSDGEAKSESIYNEFKKSDGELICVSKYGDTDKFPENSAEAVAAAAEKGADIVYVSVKKTSDGYVVLMADSNLSRMCVDELGNTVNKDIGDVGYHELSTYHLRAGTGSLHEPITSCKIPTLAEAIQYLGGNAMLMIADGWEYRDEIYDILASENALSNSIILATGDKKEISSWLASKTVMPLVISSSAKNGNVKSYVSKTLSAGCIGTLLSAKNPYNSVFKDGVQSKFKDAGRAVIDMTNSDICGGREDNPTGWNDITKRGFSVIITNDIEGFNAYRARVKSYKTSLTSDLEKAQATDTALCSTSTANKLKKTITEAKSTLSSSMSESELMEADYSLRLAMEALANRTENDNGKTVTPGRITAVVLVVIALIIFEIVFDTLRRKKVSKRRTENGRAHSSGKK